MKKNNNQGINTQIHLDMVRELREKSYTFLDFFFQHEVYARVFKSTWNRDKRGGHILKVFERFCYLILLILLIDLYVFPVVL